MNHSADPSWAQQNHFDPMEVGNDIDFSNFLNNDLGDIDLSNFDVGADNTHESQQFARLPDSTNLQFLQGGNTQTNPHHGASSNVGGQTQAEADALAAATSIFDFNTLDMDYGQQQQQPPQQRHQQQPQQQYGLQQEHHNFHPHSFVPPTPNSVEMHSDVARYLQQMESQNRAVYDQQFQFRETDMVRLWLSEPHLRT